MNKLKFSIVAVSALLFLTSASFFKSQNDIKSQLIGKWKWSKIMNPTTNEESSIETLTMGFASEIYTEINADNTYTEIKFKKGSTEPSSNKGEWKLENNEILSMKRADREKWNSSKIIKITETTLELEMNPKIHLIMTKEK